MGDPLTMTRKTLPSLLGLFAVVLAMVAISILAACGGWTIQSDSATVRAYTDAHGDPTPHADSLGFTYWGDGDGAEYEAPGANCLINAMLVGDSDPDRIVRVIVHELENAEVLRAGRYPDAIAGDWYLWSSENVPPFAAPVAEEAAWLATLPTMTVRVDSRDPWLVDPVREAVERLNDAAGREVFR